MRFSIIGKPQPLKVDLFQITFKKPTRYTRYRAGCTSLYVNTLEKSFKHFEHVFFREHLIGYQSVLLFAMFITSFTPLIFLNQKAFYLFSSVKLIWVAIEWTITPSTQGMIFPFHTLLKSLSMPSRTNNFFLSRLVIFIFSITFNSNNNK